MKDVSSQRKAIKSHRNKHAPLAQQIEDAEAPKVKKNPRPKKGHQMEEEEFIEEKLSKKILSQARKQLAEIEQDELDEVVPASKPSTTAGKNIFKKGLVASTSSSSKKKYHDSDDEDSDEEDDGDVKSTAGDSDDEDNYYAGEVQIDETDEKAMEAFMSKDAPVRRTLGDIIKEKIKEKETEIATRMSELSFAQENTLNPKIIEVYKGVGELLSKYRSGKVPKAFKIIPNLSNWEEILFLTNPESWSAAAMFMATRIFASNLNAKMAQRFFNLVLLPRVRDDIAEYKKLNFHLYMALKKSLFKPAAFFKGILLPLCQAGNCTLREAVIISSVLSKVSIPPLHSAVAMLRIADMEYSGANSIFLRVLLDKKYALPYQVIDACVIHFVQFQNDSRVLPVLWHQCLLTFVQRYKADISTEQKEALLELLKHKNHGAITPDIRREIYESKSRDIEMTYGESLGVTSEMISDGYML